MVDLTTLHTDIEHSLNQLQSIFDRQSIEEKQELANLFSVNANEAIHTIAKHEGWKEGDPRKVALHTIFSYATHKTLGRGGQSGAYVARMGARYNQGFELPESIQTIRDTLHRRYIEPRGNRPAYQFAHKPVEDELILQDRAHILGGDESIDTHAYTTSMNAIHQPVKVSKEAINKGIAITGGAVSSQAIGGAMHYEGSRIADTVMSTDISQKLLKPVAKSATKAVVMEVGGLVGDAAFTGINMNQNSIGFEGLPDLIENFYFYIFNVSRWLI